MTNGKKPRRYPESGRRIVLLLLGCVWMTEAPLFEMSIVYFLLVYILFFQHELAQ